MEVLTKDFGLNLAGWTLRQATGISQDGLVIVGYGINPEGRTEGWIADLSPALTIRQANGQVLISWSTNSPEYMLQETLDLIPSSWSNVAGPATVTNNRYVVTNLADADKKFYRLTKP